MGLLDSLEDRIRARLTDLEAAGLIRTLQPPFGIDLSSNDYLGLARHPLLRDRMMEAVRQDGCGSTGSRLLSGHRDAFSKVESRFAELKSSGRSLYFSSGYLANLGVLTTLAEAGDVVFSDERNHASLIDGIRLSRARYVIFPHNDVDALEGLLAREPGSGQKFVVVESLFGMDGDIAPLPRYLKVCRSAGAALIVDEAHAVGIFGERGSGLIEASGLRHDELISISTAGKALGVAGAFVAGPAWAIEYLIQRARPFIFSTAPPPALAAALATSLDLIASEPDRRERLQRSARYLRARLTDAGVPVAGGSSQIIPVLIGDNGGAVAVAQGLRARGFDVRAIRPPSVPVGTARLRVSVNATLDETTLDRFVVALEESLRENAACCADSL